MPNSKTHSNSGNKARHLKRQRCDMILSSRRREGGYLCLRISCYKWSFNEAYGKLGKLIVKQNEI